MGGIAVEVCRVCPWGNKGPGCVPWRVSWPLIHTCVRLWPPAWVDVARPEQSGLGQFLMGQGPLHLKAASGPLVSSDLSPTQTRWPYRATALTCSGALTPPPPWALPRMKWPQGCVATWLVCGHYT